MFWSVVACNLDWLRAKRQLRCPGGHYRGGAVVENWGERVLLPERMWNRVKVGCASNLPNTPGGTSVEVTGQQVGTKFLPVSVGAFSPRTTYGGGTYPVRVGSWNGNPSSASEHGVPFVDTKYHDWFPSEVAEHRNEVPV
jgi:hypothetical protein